MPKLRRRMRQNGDTSTLWHEAAERLAEQPFVWDGYSRLIAPWPRNAAAMGDPLNQRRLLCCLDFVRAARPGQPLWIWPERERPEPLQNLDPVWLARWAEGKACYIAR